ncbi:DoxX family protein [Streptomyces cinnamoneus]|uniref:DoxX family protein n=1 Tax=Streptomyces cinnamoneus TaxID=53446 RepID=A0A2G1XFV3_STRCJ|nr:DoxX family protein [Streptomyces cinnamoneus]PHQ50120.1 DoxX family protein [Streptomyces cinnamoneus]PPT13099.1 DoxX family protein [Streptomyces cinnamoneus]
MPVLRRLARPLLASAFVTSGVQTLQHPEAVAPMAERVALAIADHVPGLPHDAVALVRVNGAVHVGAGVLLALGAFPRLAALALAGSLVPTTLAGHAYWQEDDPAKRMQQRIHFFKNLSMLGGLLIAAADTAGRPSLGYRAKQAVPAR